nr:hypothetical protein [Tanacetum cinerariifolium]
MKTRQQKQNTLSAEMTIPNSYSAYFTLWQRGLLSDSDLEKRIGSGLIFHISSEYTQLEIPEFHDTLIQHMESVKKSIDKRTLHKRETKSKEQDTSSRSGNDTHVDDADIKPIYNEEPMAEVQLIADHNVFATGQQHTKQLEFNNEGEVDQNAEQCHETQPNAFKFEQPKISKPRCAFQIDVNNDLSKPVTTHYLPKKREYVAAKPHHVIASSNSRNSSKNMPRFNSNDMVHNHYLDEAKNKTHDIGKIFISVSLRWVPIRKIFTSSTTKVDSEPTNGLNDDITNQYECDQTLDVSAGTVTLNAELGIHDHNNEPSSSKLVLKVVPSADTTAPSKQELDLLFGPLYDEFFTVGDKGKGKEAEHDHLKVNKEKLEVDLARAIKAKQVNVHDDDLDTLALENIIKKLEKVFGRLLKTKKEKEAKKSKKEKEGMLCLNMARRIRWKMIHRLDDVYDTIYKDEEEEAKVAKESKDMALSIMKYKFLSMVESDNATVKDYTKLLKTKKEKEAKKSKKEKEVKLAKEAKKAKSKEGRIKGKEGKGDNAGRIEGKQG